MPAIKQQQTGRAAGGTPTFEAVDREMRAHRGLHGERVQ
jgi:hypothetical protein